MLKKGLKMDQHLANEDDCLTLSPIQKVQREWEKRRINIQAVLRWLGRGAINAERTCR